jgi:hypothetical protein
LTNRTAELGPASRATSSETLLNRRIYRAYANLQRARIDGSYAAIVKWTTRMDELLDHYPIPARDGHESEAMK